MNNRCILCGSELLEKPIYMCKKMPAVSQNLPTIEDLNDDKAIDLPLCQCSKCGLVQFDCDPVSYYKDSTRAGERSESLIKLRRKQYKHLIETYNLQGKKIIEIGAGKGGFLKTLKEMEEYQILEYGIENSEEFVEIAKRDENVNVFCGDPENSELKLPGAPFDAFISFSYPARLIHPNDMLDMVSNNLVDGGIGLVMVPSLEHLLKEGGFFDIVRDHIAYYSIDTLGFLFKKNGYDVLESGETSQLYIYMIVKKREAINVSKTWEDVDILVKDVKIFINEKRGQDKKIAVWCAGHFSFTIMSMADLGESVEYIIDNAPFKQDHYSPGSHILIKGPDYFKENPVDIIIIMGPIYVEEIVKEIKEKCSNLVEIFTIDKGGIKEIV